ncbi:MAG: ribosome biogenesis GTPase Der [Burkholderiaceae bacterium]|nr:ribosome biogenesis GTPase Der [Burkholderiaceae bacterium]
MKPVVALIGRTNVGKSTLFNRLTGSRAALVADFPGLTRDRQYGDGDVGSVPFLAIDTGGFDPDASDALQRAVNEQTETAIAESDVLLFVVDVRAGLTAQDARIAQRLRTSGRPIVVAANKAEGLGAHAGDEFHEVGLGAPCLISAAHRQGLVELMETALAGFSEKAGLPSDLPAVARSAKAGALSGASVRTRVAIAGRPNVGKSTLINTLIGEQRLVASEQPGTTRDAIEVEFEFGGGPFVLIDTAGLRRKGRVFETVEKFSVVKTLQAIDQCNVVVLLLDASGGIAEQDAHIAGYVLERGRALVIGVNKWDAVGADERERVKREMRRKLHFLDWASLHFISGLRGTGLKSLMRSVAAAEQAAFRRLPTPRLTRALIAAVQRQEPPRAGNWRPKLRYAHQGGTNPPVIVIHGSSLNRVPDSYRRYLEGWFRDTFELRGTPLRIEFRNAANPYAPRAGKRAAFPVD